MLSKKDLEEGQRYLQIWQRITSLPMVAHHVVFARAIEAEVRKQDDALIRQLVEALEYSSPNTNVAYAWQDERWALKRSEAITAGRARLENT